MACYFCKCGNKICDEFQDECDSCHRPIPNIDEPEEDE